METSTDIKYDFLLKNVRRKVGVRRERKGKATVLYVVPGIMERFFVANLSNTTPVYNKLNYKFHNKFLFIKKRGSYTLFSI